MKKKGYLLLLLLILIISSSFHAIDKKNSIFIEEYKCLFTPQRPNCIDTISRELDDGRLLKIFLFDCMGKMHVECYKKERKIEEGDYINSMDLLKKYIYGVNGVTGKNMIKVSEYYQPLRSGIWFLYDGKGKLLYKKEYKDGVLEKSIKIQ